MKSGPRILYIADAYLQSLFAATTIGIARALKNLGARIEPMFLSADTRDVLDEFETAHYIRCGNRSYRASALAIISIMGFLLRYWKRYDFVIVEPNAALALVPFASARRVFPRLPQIVMDVRTQPVEVAPNLKGRLAEFKFTLALKIAARLFDGMLVITKEMGSYVRSKTAPRSLPYPIGIWTSGITLELFNPDAYHAPVDLFKEKFVVMYHGQLSPTRGLDNILYAVDMVRGHYPEILAFFVGSGSMKERLVEMIKTLKLCGHAVVCDPIPHHEVPRYIKGADVGILAFPDHEWWRVQSPIKLFEYLAMETPVIATDIPMNRNVMQGHDCGFLIEDNTPERIAEGIKQAIQKKNELRRMGSVGRALVESEYSWDRQAEKILRYLAFLKNSPCAECRNM
jgi:glycosyltransferase involved in cell wall biosynthesis